MFKMFLSGWSDPDRGFDVLLPWLEMFKHLKKCTDFNVNVYIDK